MRLRKLFTVDHEARIEPSRNRLLQFAFAILVSVIAFGASFWLDKFLLGEFFWNRALSRPLDLFLRLAVEPPRTVVPLLAIGVVKLLFALIGIRFLFKATWTTETFYQWFKPFGYHWKYRGQLTAAEARDVRRLMRISAWGRKRKAGLVARVKRENKKTRMTRVAGSSDEYILREVDLGYYERIYPSASGMTFDPAATGNESRGPIVHVHGSIDLRKWSVAKFEAVRRAGHLKHPLGHTGPRTIQILSRLEPSRVPFMQTPTSPQRHGDPVLPSSIGHDYKRDILGARYDDAHPVRNWLLYRLTAKQTGQDCDKIALAAELQRVRAAGFAASPDSMNSFWTTYKQALRIWYGKTYTTKDEQLLLNLYDRGEHHEVNELFGEFARLTHTRGNFILVPVYEDPQTGRATRDTNFNLVRNRAKSDYWDLTLQGIQTGEFRAFFGEHLVAPEFNIGSMPGGFPEYIQRNSLEPYVDASGEIIPLWPAHLAPGAKYLPQTKHDVITFLSNACRAIEQRTRALANPQ